MNPDKLTPAAAEAVGVSAPGVGAASGGVFLPSAEVPSNVVHERVVRFDEVRRSAGLEGAGGAVDGTCSTTRTEFTCV
jgi:hypothetical protein